jgi:ribosomal protein L24E
VALLRENPDKINWTNLSINTSDSALELLQENPDKINWFTLSYNTNIKTAELICKFPDKIVWNNLLMVSLDPHNFMKECDWDNTVSRIPTST